MARIPFLRTFIRCVDCNCTHLLLQVHWRASSSPGCFVSEVLRTIALQIKPGQYLISQAFQHPSLKMYWELDYANKVSKSVDICTTSDSISNIPQTTVETRSEEEIIEGVRQRLLEAVRLRLRADVPVGIYLSGGLDSSAIAGMVTHLVHKEGASFGNDKSGKLAKISCLTTQFDKDSGADESGEFKQWSVLSLRLLKFKPRYCAKNG